MMRPGIAPSGGLFEPGTRSLFLLFALALILMFVDLGHTPLFEPDEGRYSEIPREMLARGDFVTPRLNGVLYFEKPPLYYWMVAASFKLFGLSESAARVPGKLASASMALMTFAFARRRYGDRIGLLAGLVVASSALVFILSRIAIIDPPLSCALAAAAFAFASFEEADRLADARRAQRALYGLHVACAAAVMLKGLVGIVLPGGAILVWAVLAGRGRLLARLFAPGPLLLFLALTVPWHVEVTRRNPDFPQFYFIHEHFDRFAKADHRRPGPLYYFVGVLIAGLLPWTAFLPRLAETFPARLAAFRERQTESFLWVFSILVFVFFSASQSKLVPYVEPIWPALGLLLAIGIERARQRGARFSFERSLTALLFGALLVAAAAWGYGAGFIERFGHGAAGFVALAGLLLGVLLNLAPAGRLTGITRRDVILPVAGPWLIFFAGLLVLLPGAARWVTPWPLVSAVLREMRPGDVLVQRGHYVQAVPFYTRMLTPVSALGWHELDFGKTRDGSAGLFPSDAEFTALWNGPLRVLAVVHRDHVRDFANPTLSLKGPPLLLGSESEGKHYLLANR
jgi:4-amino-4-deoxy-L-arabinose transferase-like glycosyltransferase